MFDQLKAVVSKASSPSLQRFRFKGKRGMATDQITVVCAENLPFETTDCYVDSKSFAEALDAYKEPVITQDPETQAIVIKEDESSSTISIEAPTKLMDIDKQPSGDDIEIGNFIEALEAVKPFIKDTLYITDGYLYCTGNNDSTVMRAPITTGFKNTIFLTADLALLLLSVKKALSGIKISDSALTFFYDGGWIESGRPNWALPANLSKHFDDFDSKPVQPLEPKLAIALKRICSIAKKDDVIDFDEKGVQLIQGTRSKHDIKIPMTNRRMNPLHLAPIIAINPSIDFTSDLQKVAFKTDKLTGFVASMEKS